MSVRVYIGIIDTLTRLTEHHREPHNSDSIKLIIEKELCNIVLKSLARM